MSFEQHSITPSQTSPLEPVSGITSFLSLPSVMTTPNPTTQPPHTPEFIAPSFTTPQSDGSVPRSPLAMEFDAPAPDAENINTSPDFTSPNASNVPLDVDAQILEALKSKDRLYVLKLGELMEGLIRERRPRIDLTPATSYQRLLVHRCSAYYRLIPESDPITKNISVVVTIESKIPFRRLAELVPAEATTQPAFKIMRRTRNDRMRSKPQSQTGSVAGEDADLSDIEPSESGSLGGRSNATGNFKKRMTIEEREAAYNEARSRIFMDFEEKEKEKEKDMSASSSTFSLVSGSASTSGGGGGSSVDDLDGSTGTPATESEWSGPGGYEMKDGRRTDLNSATSSQRSLRSNAPPFNANGSSSSRESRAPSPAFKYPSLYEPSTTSPSVYDVSQTPGQVSAPGYPPYLYPYPPNQAPPPQGYTPYQYFAPYPYQPHPQHMLPGSEHANSSGAEPYPTTHPPPPQHIPYLNPYVWPHGPQSPPLPVQQHPQRLAPQSSQALSQSNTPPNAQMPQQQLYGSYIPSPYPHYSMTGYFPGQPHGFPPGQQIPSSNMVAQPPTFPVEAPRPVNANGYNGYNIGNNRNGGNPNNQLIGKNSSTSSSPGNMNGGVKRTAPPARTAWSYGPGVGGYVGLGNGGETVGPRLSSSVRRTSGTSSTGSGSGNRTPAGDEASSTASSSTSSSSRRTFTSTSSQHPLPARPDWAVGLKPQPTLHSTHNRHHDNALNNSRNMSPARPGNHNQLQMADLSLRQPQAPSLLQSNDFPPLTMSSPPEKRTPLAGGVWTNSSSTRSILMPNPGHTNSCNNNLVHHPNGNSASPNAARLEDADRGFERPPSKGNAELFNPKGNIVSHVASNGKHAQSMQDKVEKDKEKVRGDVVASAILADRVGSMSLENQDNALNQLPSTSVMPI